MELIKSILIENVRGIRRLQLNLNIIPNKPSLLVGPNGFGKTSIARAFRSLTANGIRLDKSDFHMGDDQQAPHIELVYCDQDDCEISLSADQTTNSIGSYLDVSTIGSGVVPKATKRRIRGTVIATASLEVMPVAIVDTIPQKAEFTYSCTAARSTYGTNGKIVPNVGSFLQDPNLVIKLNENVDFRKLTGVRVSDAIEAFRMKANGYRGNKKAVLSQLASDLPLVDGIVELQKIVHCINETTLAPIQDIEKVLAAIEVACTVAANPGILSRAAKYLAYLQDRDSLAELLNSCCCSVIMSG